LSSPIPVFCAIWLINSFMVAPFSSVNWDGTSPFCTSLSPYAAAKSSDTVNVGSGQWIRRGTLAVPFGNLAAGSEISAYSAMFFESDIQDRQRHERGQLLAPTVASNAASLRGAHVQLLKSGTSTPSLALPSPNSVQFHFRHGKSRQTQEGRWNRLQAEQT
jgi:hypothetical protein